MNDQRPPTRRGRPPYEGGGSDGRGRGRGRGRGGGGGQQQIPHSPYTQLPIRMQPTATTIGSGNSGNSKREVGHQQQQQQQQQHHHHDNNINNANMDDSEFAFIAQSGSSHDTPNPDHNNNHDNKSPHTPTTKRKRPRDGNGASSFSSSFSSSLSLSVPAVQGSRVPNDPQQQQQQQQKEQPQPQPEPRSKQVLQRGPPPTASTTSSSYRVRQQQQQQPPHRRQREVQPLAKACQLQGGRGGGGGGGGFGGIGSRGGGGGGFGRCQPHPQDPGDEEDDDEYNDNDNDAVATSRRRNHVKRSRKNNTIATTTTNNSSSNWSRSNVSVFLSRGLPESAAAAATVTAASAAAAAAGRKNKNHRNTNVKTTMTTRMTVATAKHHPNNTHPNNPKGIEQEQERGGSSSSGSSNRKRGTGRTAGHGDILGQVLNKHMKNNKNKNKPIVAPVYDLCGDDDDDEEEEEDEGINETDNDGREGEFVEAGHEEEEEDRTQQPKPKPQPPQPQEGSSSSRRRRRRRAVLQEDCSVQQASRLVREEEVSSDLDDIINDGNEEEDEPPRCRRHFQEEERSCPSYSVGGRGQEHQEQEQRKTKLLPGYMHQLQTPQTQTQRPIHRNPPPAVDFSTVPTTDNTTATTTGIDTAAATTTTMVVPIATTATATATATTTATSGHSLHMAIDVDDDDNDDNDNDVDNNKSSHPHRNSKRQSSTTLALMDTDEEKEEEDDEKDSSITIRIDRDDGGNNHKIKNKKDAAGRGIKILQRKETPPPPPQEGGGGGFQGIFSKAFKVIASPFQNDNQKHLESSSSPPSFTPTPTKDLPLDLRPDYQENKRRKIVVGKSRASTTSNSRTSEAAAAAPSSKDDNDNVDHAAGFSSSNDDEEENPDEEHTSPSSGNQRGRTREKKKKKKETNDGSGDVLALLKNVERMGGEFDDDSIIEGHSTRPTAGGKATVEGIWGSIPRRSPRGPPLASPTTNNPAGLSFTKSNNGGVGGTGRVSQRPATYGNGKRKGAGKLVIAGASFTMNTGDHENSYRRSTRGQNHELHQIQRGRDSITEFSSQDTYAGSSYLNDDSTTNIDGLRRSRRKSAGRNSTISRSPDVVCLSSDDDNDGDDDNEVEEVEMDHEPNIDMELRRIAIGKKVAFAECHVTFDPNRSELYLKWKNTKTRKTRSDDGQGTATMELCLRDGSLQKIAVYKTPPVPAASNGNGDTGGENSDQEISTNNTYNNYAIDHLGSFLAMEFKPTQQNRLDKYSKLYKPDHEETRFRYIVLEFRDRDDLRLFADRCREKLLVRRVSYEELDPKTCANYAQSLLDNFHSEKRLQQRNKFVEGRALDHTLLVYPFAGDAQEMESATQGLTEAAGSLEVVEKKRSASMESSFSSSDDDQGEGKTRKRAHFVTINVEDYDRLEPGEWLNDSLVDLWMQWISRDNTTLDSKFHFFTSHFYSTLEKDGPEAVASWTKRKKINVFEKRLIFIPINKHMHWSLCVIVNPGAIVEVGDQAYTKDDPLSCMLFMDSLRMHNKSNVARHIRRWLNSEWHRMINEKLTTGSTPIGKEESFRSDNFRIFSPTVPLQNNTWDCGVFVCRYAYAIYELRNREFTYEDAGMYCDETDVASGVEGEAFRSVITDGAEFAFGMKDIARFREEFKTLIERLTHLYKKVKHDETMAKLEQKRLRQAVSNEGSNAVAGRKETSNLKDNDTFKNAHPAATVLDPTQQNTSDVSRENRKVASLPKDSQNIPEDLAKEFGSEVDESDDSAPNSRASVMVNDLHGERTRYEILREAKTRFAVSDEKENVDGLPAEAASQQAKSQPILDEDNMKLADDSILV